MTWREVEYNGFGEIQLERVPFIQRGYHSFKDDEQKNTYAQRYNYLVNNDL